MDKRQLATILRSLGLSPKKAATFLSVDAKTVQRWLDGVVDIPGPAEQALHAWSRLERLGLPWRPEEGIPLWLVDEAEIAKQIELLRSHTMKLDEVVRKVRARGGPAAPWKVNLQHHEAELAGTMRVSFYALHGGGFSPSGYTRTDKEPDEQRDLPLIEDAIVCIAEAVKAAGKNWSTVKS